jgi:hypothetical protein
MSVWRCEWRRSRGALSSQSLLRLRYHGAVAHRISPRDELAMFRHLVPFQTVYHCRLRMAQRLKPRMSTRA